MLDAAIKSFKATLARTLLVEHTRDWSTLVPWAEQAYNNTVHSSLVGKAPRDVPDDAELQYALQERAGHAGP